MSKRKWGESFLKSGLPLEYLAMLEFKKLGWDISPHVEFPRSTAENGISWFEIDFEAEIDCNDDTQLCFLVECKYHDPSRFWIFLPHEPTRWHFDDRILNFGPLQKLSDPKANTFLDLTPASSWGIVVSEHGEKQENAFQKAVYQVAGALVPRCLFIQYDFNLNLDNRDGLPQFFTAIVPAIVTNSPLFRMRPDVVNLDDIREASSPAEIADEMPWAWYYFDPPMDFINQQDIVIDEHESENGEIRQHFPEALARMKNLAGRPNWIAVINIGHLASAIKAIYNRFLACSVRTTGMS